MNIEDQPKIRVVVRKRPMNKKEINKGDQDIVDVKNCQTVSVRQQKYMSLIRQKVDLTKYIDQQSFTFDRAFDQHTTNQTIYATCVKPLLHSAFNGAKVTCFAYGQTGSGKTYTMNGDQSSKVPGLYSLGGLDIFRIRQQPQFKKLNIYVSFFEIYCGKLFDLLNQRQQLHAREDAKQNVNIVGLKENKLQNAQHFLQIIEHGSQVRITSQNSINADSSRSHAILQVSLRQKKQLVGKISFIDLAGCQRGIDAIDMNKQTRIDGAQINKSLLALKQCIRALDQGKTHTPFRGSKLTMVLKDSFIGYCKTLMIGNISPNSGSCQNTLNTLRYADRVKELKKGSNEQLSKEDMLAKQLMLPRMQKNTKKLEIKSDDEEDQVQQEISNNMIMEEAVQISNSQLFIQEQVFRKQNYQHLFPETKTEKNNKPKVKESLKKNNRPKSKASNIDSNVGSCNNINNNHQNNYNNYFNNGHNKMSYNNISNNYNNISNQSMTNMNYKKCNSISSNNHLGPVQKNNLTNRTKQTLRQIDNINISNRLPTQNTVDEFQILCKEIDKWYPKNHQDIAKMAERNQNLISNCTLLAQVIKEQSEIIDLHRNDLNNQVQYIKEQMVMLKEMQSDPAAVMNYTLKLQSIVNHKFNILNNLKEKQLYLIRLSKFKKHLNLHNQFEKKLMKMNQQISGEFSLLDDLQQCGYRMVNQNY